MGYRSLLVIPLVGTAALVAAALLLPEGRPVDLLLNATGETAKALSLLGSLAAALAFARGEYLRRAWLLYGGCMLVLLVRDALVAWLLPTGPAWVGVVRGGLTLLANLSAVLGTWMLASAWRVAGLQLPGPRWARTAVLLAAAGLALAFAGPAVVVNVGQVLDGQTDSLVWIASGLGDLIILCLIAPLLLTALALRGGALGWPWALLTASSMAWLVFDAALALLPLLEASAESVRLVTEACRTLACLLGLVAGLAQRRVSRSLQSAQSASGE